MFLDSFFLICSRGSLAVSGLLFWCLAARLYSVEEIGYGAALISFSSLLIFISSLGIVPTFIKFIPQEKNKARLLITFFFFSSAVLALFYFIFLLSAVLFFPKILLLKNTLYSILFFFFVLSMLIYQGLEGVYIALKSTPMVLVNNIIQNFLRLLFLFVLVVFSGFGIFASNCLAAMAAILVTAVYLMKKYPNSRLTFNVDQAVFKKLFNFSFVNFLSSIPLLLPGMVFPLLIVIFYSGREAGLFYIPWMIFSVYCSLITSVSSVFLMKASYGQDIKNLLKKTLFLSFGLGALGFFIFMFLAEPILLIFKKDFSLNSPVFLRLLFCSIFFFIVNQIYTTILNIRHQVKSLAGFAAIIILSLLVFVFILMPKLGINGIGLAWLVSNFIGNIYICWVLFVQKQKLW